MLASVMKKLDLAADRESPLSLTLVSSVQMLVSVSVKSSPAIPPTLTNSSNNIPTRSPSAWTVISVKVEGGEFWA